MNLEKTPRIQPLVVKAIRKLENVQGWTAKEISNYISREYEVPSEKIQRHVRLALARGVSYGYLHRPKRGHYACNQDLLSSHPQSDGSELMDKCGPMKRRKSKKSRKRKNDVATSATTKGGKRRGRRRGKKRAASRRGRRRTRGRSKRGKTVGRKRRRGGMKLQSRKPRRSGRKKSRQHSKRKRSSRRRKSRRSGQNGKTCTDIDFDERPDADEQDFDIFSGKNKTRIRSASSGSKRNQSLSLHRRFKPENPQDKRINSWSIENIDNIDNDFD